MELKNLTETLVARALEEVSKHYQFCSCERCRSDIFALALNNLPPSYVVSEKGDVYTRAEMLKKQKDLDVFNEVIKAVKKVQQNPRH